MKRITQTIGRQTAEEFNRSKRLPAGFEVRVCGAEDVEHILAVGRATFSYNAPTFEEIHYALTRAHAVIFGIFEGANMIGYVFLEGHMGHKNLYINTTTLLEPYRGKGLGSALYQLKDLFAKNLGAKGIWCHTAIDNDVNIHLLEKAGYGRVRTEENYYEDGKAAAILRKTIAAGD